jgi:hypothetical protein
MMVISNQVMKNEVGNQLIYKVVADAYNKVDASPQTSIFGADDE